MRRIALACLSLLLVSACGDDGTEATTNETLVTSEVETAPSTTGPASDELPTDPCDAAFADVAGAASGDVEALFPAARECSDLADWIAAAEAHPDVIGDEDPAILAEEVCQAGEGLSATALCQEVLATS